MTLDVFAPAKVNLALHITGKRADGYHLLDSLVVFADVCDLIKVTRAPTTELKVTGPFAQGVPADDRNLVWKAAEWAGKPAQMILDKRLPHAAGIGGGSTDAAAVLAALGTGPAGSEVLGADVPVCWHKRPSRMSGIGEAVTQVPELPPMWIVLVNAGEAVSTGAVFNAMENVYNTKMPEPHWQDFDSFISWLKGTRNDMEEAAKTVSPVISEVLERLGVMPGCAIARMSGSGGTCFGLFSDKTAAQAATNAMPQGWWAQAAPVLSP